MITTWVIGLFFCVNNLCYQMVLPPEYILKKECAYHASKMENVHKMYNIPKDIEVQSRCVNTDFISTEVDRI
jgi:hypothetical protein